MRSALRGLALVAAAVMAAACDRPARFAHPDAAAPAGAPLAEPGNAPPGGTGRAAAADTVRAVIQQYRFTTLRPECYVLQDEPDQPAYTFTAREQHDSACGGEPHVMPRLFAIRWDPATGAVLADMNAVVRGDTVMDTVRRATRQHR